MLVKNILKSIKYLIIGYSIPIISLITKVPIHMGNRYHEFTSSNMQFIRSISEITPQYDASKNKLQSKKQFVYSPKKIQSIPLPAYQSSFDLEQLPTSTTSIQKTPLIPPILMNTSLNNHIDDKKRKSLDLIINILKDKEVFGGFKVATHENILRYNNKLLKNIEVPLYFEEGSWEMQYPERAQPFLIKLSQLPDPGFNMPDTWVYLGQWYQDFPHGIGKIYHNDFKYEGYVSRGIPHRKGRRITLDDIYEGQFQMNRREGFGRLVTRTQYFYQGFWMDDIRNGDGYEIHKNGCVFQGEYVDDKVSMGGFYIPRNEVKKKLNNIQNSAYLNLVRTQFKQKYYGQFLNNRFEGKGDYIWIDGRSYQGSWKGGKMHGEGIFTWPNGKKYEGSYFNNKKNGFGKFYSLPKVFEGLWEDGKPHGKGKIIDGQNIYYRVWYKGKMIRDDKQQELFSLISSQQEQFPDEMSSCKLSQYNTRR